MHNSLQFRLVDKARVGATAAASLLVLGFTTQLVTAQSTSQHSTTASIPDETATNAQLQAQIKELRSQVERLQKGQQSAPDSGTDAATPMPVKEQNAPAMGKHMQMMAKHMQDMGKRMEQKGMKMEKKGVQMEQKKCCSSASDQAKVGMDMGKMDMDMQKMNMDMDAMDKDTMSTPMPDKPMNDKSMESNEM